MTIQTAVLIETLVALGAEVRWASLQHLLDPGPRRRGGRRRAARHARAPAGRAGLRLEGRDAGGVLVVHRAGARLAGRRWPQHDPRRRRRRHPPRAQGRRVRAGRRRCPTPTTADSEEYARRPRRCSGARSSEDPQRWTRVAAGDPAASPRRPPPASTASTRCRSDGDAALPGDQRQRLGHQVASSTTCTAAATRSIDGINRATDVLHRRQGRRRLRLRRRRQGLLPSRCAARAPA